MIKVFYSKVINHILLNTRNTPKSKIHTKLLIIVLNPIVSIVFDNIFKKKRNLVRNSNNWKTEITFDYK